MFVVIVYHIGNVTQVFYDQFYNILERLTTFSALLIVVGDFNIHTDDLTDADANEFADMVSCNGFSNT
jgi:exonuclease III